MKNVLVQHIGMFRFACLISRYGKLFVLGLCELLSVNPHTVSTPDQAINLISNVLTSVRFYESPSVKQALAALGQDWKTIEI